MFNIYKDINRRGDTHYTISFNKTNKDIEYIFVELQKWDIIILY